MKTLLKFVPVIVAALLAATASPVKAIPYTLNNSTATVVSGNTTSSFYESTGAGVDSGTAASLYTATVGGTASAGWWVEIAFGSNPQPVLTSAFMKAGNNYLYWDSTDLTAFNAGTFTSIIIYQDGLKNPPGNAYLGISHAGLNGRAGTKTTVPDSGTTLGLFGLGCTGLVMLRRRLVS